MRKAVNVALAAVFEWSIKACMTGTHPSLDPFGKPFPDGSLLLQKAGQAFTTSWRILSFYQHCFVLRFLIWFNIGVANCNVLIVSRIASQGMLLRVQE